MTLTLARSERMTTRHGASASLRTWCAPSGPAGKQTTSPARSTSSPSGVRTVGVPERTMSHSSLAASQWYGHARRPGGSSMRPPARRSAPMAAPRSASRTSKPSGVPVTGGISAWSTLKGPMTGSAVPDHEGAHVALPPQAADRAGAEQQVAAELDRPLNPAGAERAQDVAVRDAQDVVLAVRPGGGGQLGREAVAARRDVVRRLAARPAVAPQPPVRPLTADVARRDALVLAVVPLAQLLADLGAVADPGELGGVPGAAQRADEDAGEAVRAHARRQR